jgi:hypothetical protein
MFHGNGFFLNWLFQSQSYITTDGQTASLSSCEATIWGLRPDFYYCLTVACLFMWGAVSDERTGLPFTSVSGPRQRSRSWVRLSQDSWPYFTVSDSRLPQPGGPGPRIFQTVSLLKSRHGPRSTENTALYCCEWITLSQSQNYFKSGGITPISSSWRRAPWDSRP